MSNPALLTTFTPPASCSTALQLSGIYGTSYLVKYGPPDAQVSSCFPPGWQPNTSSFFSPAIPANCPLGYLSACSSLFVVGDATETRATCCPVNYACYTGTEPWFQGEMCTSNVGINQGSYTLTTSSPDGNVQTRPFALGSGDGVNAYGVAIRWQSTDLTTPTPTTSATAGATPGSPTVTPTGAAATTTSAPSSSSGLSTGAIAGLGSGLGVLAILIILAVAFCIYRRQHRRHAATLPVVASGSSAAYASSGVGIGAGSSSPGQTTIYGPLSHHSGVSTYAGSPGMSTMTHGAYAPPGHDGFGKGGMAYDGDGGEGGHGGHEGYYAFGTAADAAHGPYGPGWWGKGNGGGAMGGAYAQGQAVEMDTRPGRPIEMDGGLRSTSSRS